MWIWVTVLLAVIVTLTAWVTLHVRGRILSAAWVAPLWGGGACLMLLIGAFAYSVNAQRVYDKCISDVERSRGSRSQTLYLYDVIDAATHSTRFTSEPVIEGQPSLRAALDINLPLLDPQRCTKP